MTDEQIIALFNERNELAITELNEKYRAYCWSVSYGILKNNEDTEECFNDMLNGVWKTIPPNHPDNLKSYCGRIIRNLSLNRLQASNAKKRGGALGTQSLDDLDFKIASSDSIDDKLFASEIKKIINDFLESLPKEKRIIFVRKYWYFDSIEKISKRMRLSSSNVKVILHRLRESLKTELKKGGFEIE